MPSGPAVLAFAIRLTACSATTMPSAPARWAWVGPAQIELSSCRVIGETICVALLPTIFSAFSPAPLPVPSKVIGSPSVCSAAQPFNTCWVRSLKPPTMCGTASRAPTDALAALTATTAASPILTFISTPQ